MRGRASNSLVENAVVPLVRGRFGQPYRYEPECESTQLLLDPDGPEGALAVTELQTAGRGRLGRTWEAPARTAIQCSLLLQPPPERPPHELTVVAALAVAEAVEDATGLTAQVKWPNDVLVEGRKVAGLLGELRDGAVLLGIGVNVNQDENNLPTTTRRPAGSLRSVTGRRFDRAPLLADILARLEERYDAWRAGGLNALARDLGTREWRREEL